MQIFNLKIDKKKLVSFKKIELNQILAIYSSKISTGEWKDYSITFRNHYALFSIHKSFSFFPSFQIIKYGGKKKVSFSLFSEKKILIKSKSLKEVLNYFKKPKLKLIR